MVEEMTAESKQFYLQDHNESLFITMIAFQPKHGAVQFLQVYTENLFRFRSLEI